MKTAVAAFAWLLLIASCREISFKEPQPAGVAALKEIPKSIQGQYLSYDQKTGEKSDTIIIESWGYHFKDSMDKDWLGRGVLSDTLVIKFYNDYYFVNFKVVDQWVLRLVNQKPSGAIEFLSIDIQDEEQRKSILKKLSRKLKVIEKDINGDLFYQIDPNPDQLIELIKEGFFTGPELNKVR
jgi:hypothetical protein